MRGTSTVSGHALPGRRAVLAGVAAAVVAGVSGCDLRLEGGDPPPSSGRRRTPSPDERAQQEQSRVATSLAAATRAVPATLAARPLLSRCAAQDDAHAAALGPSSTATTAPATTAPDTTAPAPVPGSHATVTVAALGTSLATAAVDARDGLHDLTPGTARLLASVAAARTVQRSRLVPGSVPATVAGQPAAAPTTAPTTSPTGSRTAPAGRVSTSGAALAASSPSAATTGQVAALDRALAAEHAALYGLGVAGAWASPADRLRVLAAQTWHAARREALTDLVRGAGGTPSSALAAYRLPFPVTSPAAARALAVTVEVGVATTYADLVADGPAERRDQAAAWLADTAVRVAGWRGDVGPAFPGLPERGWR